MYFGAAKTVMNPPIGTHLSGFPVERACTGIHDSIHAKVLAIGEHTADMLIISLDVVGIDAEYVRELREKIEERYSVPAENILVHATHTHSGPGGTIRETSVVWKAFKHWMPYNRELVLNQHEKILQAVRDAIETLEPCTIFYGSGLVEGIAANRISPERHYKPELQVLEFRTVSGKRSIVYHFACHPTILHADNLDVSADFPGAASSYLEAEEDVEVALFLNGPSGDVSTRFTRRQTSFDEVNRIGQILADKVVDVLNKKVQIHSSECISRNLKLELNIRSFDSHELMQWRLEELRNAFKEAQSSNFLQAELRRMESEIEGASASIQLSSKLRDIASVETEVQIIRLGDLYFIGIPGEMFYESGQKINDAFGMKNSTEHILMLGNTNDYIGYIVPRPYYESNSYESSMTLLQEDSAEIIVSLIKKELLQMQKVQK